MHSFWVFKSTTPFQKTKEFLCSHRCHKSIGKRIFQGKPSFAGKTVREGIRMHPIHEGCKEGAPQLMWDIKLLPE